MSWNKKYCSANITFFKYIRPDIFKIFYKIWILDQLYKIDPHMEK